jgi:hypothetical protein
MAGAGSTKVVIRTTQGRYLGGDVNSLRLVNDIYGAVLLDPAEVQMEETLLELQNVTGLVFEAMPLKMEEVFETCDGCGQMAVPFTVFFDGRKFLCLDCRAEGCAANRG